MDDETWISLAGNYVTAIHTEIRELQKQAQTVLGAGIAAGTFSAAIGNDFSPTIALLSATLLWGFASAWYANLNAEVAARAEERNYISHLINEKLSNAKQPLTYLFPYTSKIGQSAYGTVAAVGVIGFILFALMTADVVNAAGLVPALRGSSSAHSVQFNPIVEWVVTILVVLFVTAAVIAALIETPRYRDGANTILRRIDSEFADWQIPTPRRFGLTRIGSYVLRRDRSENRAAGSLPDV